MLYCLMSKSSSRSSLPPCTSSLYLTVAERWKYFHATLFEAEIVGSMGPGGQEVQAWLAVEEDKLSVLSRDFEPLHAFHYRQLRHFGTSAGDFRIVVRTDKGKFQFLFRLEKVCGFWSRLRPDILLTPPPPNTHTLAEK